jgi:hypothetical protein
MYESMCTCMCAYIHVFICMCAYACTHAYTPAFWAGVYAKRQKQKSVNAVHQVPSTDTYIYTYKNTHTHVNTHLSYIHQCVHIHTYARTRCPFGHPTCSEFCCTHTYIRTYMYIPGLLIIPRALHFVEHMHTYIHTYLPFWSSHVLGILLYFKRS